MLSNKDKVSLVFIREILPKENFQGRVNMKARPGRMASILID